MFEKNSFLFGLGLGLLATLAGYVFFASLYKGIELMGWLSSEGFRPYFRQRTCGLLAMMVNAYFLNSFQKRYLNNTVKGLVIAILLSVGVWLAIFGKYVL